ncbi:MAG TPA: diacylglycerol kinase family protein [Candidatus Saccharimonadia bacterium]|nr:diacylglycerol kinase family protein [Candidatus Saccharimonadia bacterium]
MARLEAALRKFVKGFYYALQGVVYVFRYERNARVHLLFAIAAFMLGLVLGVSDAELAAIFFAVIIVFLAEIFNTAIEKTLDLVDTNHNPKIMIIKDMAAGAVLLAAVAAAMIGVVIFAPYLVREWPR